MFIDELRGVAAIMVLFQHISERIMVHDSLHSEYLHDFFSKTVNTGRFGVAIFFLVSGFVIPFSFRSPAPLRRFLLGRFFRLYPCYWLSLVFAVLVLTCFCGAKFSGWTLFANFTMVEMALKQPVVQGPYWTMILELTFYFACASLFACGILVNRRVLTCLVVLLLCLSLVGTVWGALTHEYRSSNLTLNFALMFLGSVIRQSTKDRAVDLGIIQMSMNGLILVGFTIIVIVSSYLFTPSRCSQFITPLGFGAGYVCGIIFFLLFVLYRVRTNPLLQFLGTVSYSLYLFHDVCLSYFERVIDWDGSLRSHFLFFLVSVAASMAMATISYYGLERPCINFSALLQRYLIPSDVCSRVLVSHAKLP